MLGHLKKLFGRTNLLKTSAIVAGVGVLSAGLSLLYTVVKPAEPVVALSTLGCTIGDSCDFLMLATGGGMSDPSSGTCIAHPLDPATGQCVALAEYPAWSGCSQDVLPGSVAYSPPDGAADVCVWDCSAASGFDCAWLPIDSACYDVPGGDAVSLSKMCAPTHPCTDPVRIMPLGDSITYGLGSGFAAEDWDSMVGYRASLWHALVDDSYFVDFVGSQHNGSTQDEEFDDAHEGWGGYTTDQIESGVYGWLTDNPADVVLLHIGINDIAGAFMLGAPPTDLELDGYVQNVADTLDLIDQYDTDTGGHTTVVLAEILDTGGMYDEADPYYGYGEAFTASVVSYNAKLETMATARMATDDIVLVDMTDANLIDLYAPTGDWADSVHPALSGYEKMATIWKAGLDSILPQCSYFSCGDNITQGYEQCDDQQKVCAWIGARTVSGMGSAVQACSTDDDCTALDAMMPGEPCVVPNYYCNADPETPYGSLIPVACDPANGDADCLVGGMDFGQCVPQSELLDVAFLMPGDSCDEICHFATTELLTLDLFDDDDGIDEFGGEWYLNLDDFGSVINSYIFYEEDGTTPVLGTEGAPYAARLEGSRDASGWIGIGTDFNMSTDVRSCTGIQFYQKGDGNQHYIQLVTAYNGTGEDQDYDTYLKYFATSGEWQLFRVPFTSFAQTGWGIPRGLEDSLKVLQGVAFQGGPAGSVYLTVDDIQFYGCSERVLACGDGVVDLGESCDEDTPYCIDCQAICGDGVAVGNEACDSGGVDTESCNADCTLPVCGDGHLNTASGEQCDDGNTDNNDYCTNACEIPVCGDGIKSVGEACDFGEANGDYPAICSAACTLNWTATSFDPDPGPGYTDANINFNIGAGLIWQEEGGCVDQIIDEGTGEPVCVGDLRVNNITNYTGDFESGGYFKEVYEDALQRLADAGGTEFRYSLAWARLMPCAPAIYDEMMPDNATCRATYSTDDNGLSISQMEHLRDVLEFAKARGIRTQVVLNHWMEPAWLENDGWDALAMTPPVEWWNPDVVSGESNYPLAFYTYVSGLLSTPLDDGEGGTEYIGDYVDLYASFNEQVTIAYPRYIFGLMWPNHVNQQGELENAIRNSAISHEIVYDLIKDPTTGLDPTAMVSTIEQLMVHHPLPPDDELGGRAYSGIRSMMGLTYDADVAAADARAADYYETATSYGLYDMITEDGGGDPNRYLDYLSVNQYADFYAFLVPEWAASAVPNVLDPGTGERYGWMPVNGVQDFIPQMSFYFETDPDWFFRFPISTYATTRALEGAYARYGLPILIGENGILDDSLSVGRECGDYPDCMMRAKWTLESLYQMAEFNANHPGAFMGYSMYTLFREDSGLFMNTFSDIFTAEDSSAVPLYTDITSETYGGVITRDLWAKYDIRSWVSDHRDPFKYNPLVGSVEWSLYPARNPDGSPNYDTASNDVNPDTLRDVTGYLRDVKWCDKAKPTIKGVAVGMTATDPAEGEGLVDVVLTVDVMDHCDYYLDCSIRSVTSAEGAENGAWYLKNGDSGFGPLEARLKVAPGKYTVQTECVDPYGNKDKHVSHVDTTEVDGGFSLRHIKGLVLAAMKRVGSMLDISPLLEWLGR